MRKWLRQGPRFVGYRKPALRTADLRCAEGAFDASDRFTAELGAVGAHGASEESGGCKRESSSHPAGGPLLLPGQNQPRDRHPPHARARAKPSLASLAGVPLLFANSEQPVLAGSPLAIEAIQKSAMDQRARCRRTTERHSVGGISLF